MKAATAEALPPPSPGRPAAVPAVSGAVVGAGFAGTMAAIQLSRLLPPDHVVLLLDGSGRFGRGVAYADTRTPYLLNVRAGNMSAFPDDPGHFERWLAKHEATDPAEVSDGPEGRFATRRLYGRYLRTLLREEMRRCGGRLRLRTATVDAMAPSGSGWRLRCRGDAAVEASAAVVALGNLPSGQICDGAVFHNPWAPEALAGLRPDEPVVIVGTGLTMVDLTLGLVDRGLTGPIVAVSRRGLLPQRHAAPEPPVPPDWLGGVDAGSMTALLRAVRHQVADAAERGTSWRTVIDGLRPVTAQLWQSLPRTEQRRFLRHLRPYWDSHRHRRPLGPADVVDGLLRRGQLRVVSGTVEHVDVRHGPHGPAVAVRIRRRGCGGTETVAAQRVIHAMGAGKPGEGLSGRMIADGIAAPDPFGLGLDVDGALCLSGPDGGSAERGLWCLGPPTRGRFWESTSVPDIRVQAARVAAEVAVLMRR